MGLRAVCKAWMKKYEHFAERQGFAIIAVVCVGVITATAVWTGQKEVYVAPTPPVSNDLSAAHLLQQTLRDVATPAPSPTAAPQLWSAPLQQLDVLRPYNAETMVQNEITGIWAIHDAVDLLADPGDRVYAMADGVVTSIGEDLLLGTWLKVDHGSGTEALYAGLALSAAYIAGDKVRQGDTIGFAGNGPLDETDMAPHLHLRVTQNGRAIDPTLLWAANAK